MHLSPQPLYAFDAGHPLRLLTRRGAWEECVVVSRAAGCNQFVLRMPPVGAHYWAPLLPWNHYSLPFHPNVPLFGVHGYDETKWAEAELVRSD